MAGGVQAGPGFLPWDRLSDAPLDPQIRPLVEALNRTTWARTVFSCAGHPDEPDSVPQGRRQAHIDALIADEQRWHTFTHTLRRTAQQVRIAEGSLGEVPEWLRAFGDRADGGAGAERAQRARTPQNRLGGAGGAQRPPAGSRAEPWHYRRLVIEPKPYDMPPDRCRQTLDSAIQTALAILQQSRR